MGVEIDKRLRIGLIACYLEKTMLITYNCLHVWSSTNTRLVSDTDQELGDIWHVWKSTYKTGFRYFKDEAVKD